MQRAPLPFRDSCQCHSLAFLYPCINFNPTHNRTNVDSQSNSSDREIKLNCWMKTMPTYVVSRDKLFKFNGHHPRTPWL